MDKKQFIATFTLHLKNDMSIPTGTLYDFFRGWNALAIKHSAPTPHLHIVIRCNDETEFQKLVRRYLYKSRFDDTMKAYISTPLSEEHIVTVDLYPGFLSYLLLDIDNKKPEIVWRDRPV